MTQTSEGCICIPEQPLFTANAKDYGTNCEHHKGTRWSYLQSVYSASSPNLSFSTKLLSLTLLVVLIQHNHFNPSLVPCKPIKRC